MKTENKPYIGIYEKALPPVKSWGERLERARDAGYDFVEMSIDESDVRLSRLEWTARERADFRETVAISGLRVPSICLSGHRRFPFGSTDPQLREKAWQIMEKGIELAADIGVRTLQLAGYDVYYEKSTPESQKLFFEGMERAAARASKLQVMLAMEIMDYPLMNSITRWKKYADQIKTPWFQVYPDIGNLSAWWNDIPEELALGLSHITAIHLKDTLAVGPNFSGQFRDIPFGEGCVDFSGLFKILTELKYQGSFLIEMWTEKAEDPIAEIKNARTWILEKMKAGGFYNA